MAHTNTVLNQLLKLVPRHEFESLAKAHHCGHSFRTASRWSQFVSLAMGQLSGRSSLRDIVENLNAQAHRLYHLGSAKLTRSNLSRINESKPYTLYEALFGRLLARCQAHAPSHGFKFENPLYSLDASTIDLCLSVFPWAEARSTKSAIKLHVGLNHAGHLPEFVRVTDGKCADVTLGRMLTFPKGSIVVMDRGYTDFSWYNQLMGKGIFFVTRLKKNSPYQVVESKTRSTTTGVCRDQTIKMTGKVAWRECPIPLRRVAYVDPESGQVYAFLSNHFELDAQTLADLYKSRWQVELFLKWIKQHLKIKTYVGTSKNAVLTQIWVVLCVYLILAFLKFQSGCTKSLHQMLQVLQLNLFEKRDLMALLKGEPPWKNQPSPDQMTLW